MAEEKEYLRQLYTDATCQSRTCVVSSSDASSGTTIVRER